MVVCLIKEIIHLVPQTTIQNDSPYCLSRLYDFMNLSVDLLIYFLFIFKKNNFYSSVLVHNINSSWFSYILHIFSFTDFLPKKYTAPDSLWCYLSNQGCYFYFCTLASTFNTHVLDGLESCISLQGKVKQFQQLWPNLKLSWFPSLLYSIHSCTQHSTWKYWGYIPHPPTNNTLLLRPIYTLFCLTGDTGRW